MEMILYVLENVVDCSVSTTSIPPSFDNSFVVPIKSVMLCSGIECCDRSSEELKSDCFSPSNVVSAVEGFPIWYKSPGPPSVFNNNGDSNPQTGIRESADIDE